MIDAKQFRKEGFIYDSLENYTDLIDFEKFKDIKSKIDNKNIKRFSKYDYWYKFKDLSYMEEIIYENLLKRDKNLDVADFVYQKSHEYMLKKIQDCGFYPTWVFGTSMDSEVDELINSDVISNFQLNFARKYYSEKLYNSYYGSSKLQFYDMDCEIKLHDDGQPEDRVCVFLYFLNNEWNEENGGHLILYTKENERVKINPVFPNFVVLDSDINLFHEVEKVKKGIKYNVVSFYNGKN
jgi:Rps23 Pro-64 3,4-dihydroxylase Tpa1-like proline 4-hydroxylase